MKSIMPTYSGRTKLQNTQRVTEIPGVNITVTRDFISTTSTNPLGASIYNKGLTFPEGGRGLEILFQDVVVCIIT